jgi:uncharacterized membrane protein YdbT with pleckstrin-like domain
MPSHQQTDDPAQAERAWIGYHPRAAAPAVVVATVLSLVVWTGRWYLGALVALADRVGALAVFAPVWCLWLVLVALYAYRAATYTYRLTDRAVLVDYGFRHRPVPPVWLRDITQVRTGGDWLHRLLGVGWVEVQTADRLVRLAGVRDPEAFAKLIREAAFETNRTAPTPVEK